MQCEGADVQRVVGHAGGSLVDATWAANKAVARVGRRAELRTAEVLDRLAKRSDGPTVLHDLAIPIPGITANIDHVVVSGRRVLIIDSKGWKPARYWSLGSAAFRGFRRFQHATTRTPRMAHQSLTGYLRGRGVKARLVTPVVAVAVIRRREGLGRVAVTELAAAGADPGLAARMAAARVVHHGGLRRHAGLMRP